MLNFIAKLADLYVILIIIRAILSWFSIDPNTQPYLLLIKITEPVLAPLRKLIPIAGIDLSPIIAILLIRFVVGFLVQ